MTAPRVSVILPHYRQAWALPLALRSLALQEFRDFELIVVDDGTPLQEFVLPPLPPEGCVLVRHPENRGTAAAINTGFELARGEYVTWVSADNWMASCWLARLVAVLDGDPTVGAVYGGFAWCPRTAAEVAILAARLDRWDLQRLELECHARGRDRAPSAPDSSYASVGSRYLFVPHEPGRQIAQEACYYGPAFLMQRSIWQAAGPHEGRISHDLGHWLRVEEACWDAGAKVVGVDEPLCWYFAHEKRATVERAAEYDAPALLAAARERRAAKYGGRLVP